MLKLQNWIPIIVELTLRIRSVLFREYGLKLHTTMNDGRRIEIIDVEKTRSRGMRRFCLSVANWVMADWKWRLKFRNLPLRELWRNRRAAWTTGIYRLQKVAWTAREIATILREPLNQERWLAEHSRNAGRPEKKPYFNKERLKK
jgi:hypothetical protein